MEATNTHFPDAHKDDNGKAEFRFVMDFVIFMDGGLFISYCPSLDISSYGDTYNEAISNFYEMFQLHIESCLAAGTLHDDLLSHGWTLRKDGVTPPPLTKLFDKPEMKRLIEGNANFERIATPARIPAFA